MPELKFFDVKRKKEFRTDKFDIVVKKTKSGKRKFAVANAPSGIKAFRIVSMDFKK